MEGHFLERFARSAYRKTMAEQTPKILFNHGKDPEIGEKIIATTDEVGEDEISPYARGGILDGLPELVVSTASARAPTVPAIASAWSARRGPRSPQAARTIPTDSPSGRSPRPGSMSLAR